MKGAVHYATPIHQATYIQNKRVLQELILHLYYLTDHFGWNSVTSGDPNVSVSRVHQGFAYASRREVYRLKENFLLANQIAEIYIHA